MRTYPGCMDKDKSDKTAFRGTAQRDSGEVQAEIVRKIKGLKVLSRTRTKHDKFGFIAQNRDKNVRQSNVRNY